MAGSLGLRPSMGGAAGQCRARSCQNDIHGAIAARFLNPAQSADRRRK
jgi:hypothetical protein